MYLVQSFLRSKKPLKPKGVVDWSEEKNCKKLFIDAI